MLKRTLKGTLSVLPLAMILMATATAGAADLYSSGDKDWNTDTLNTTWGTAPGSYSGTAWTNTAPPNNAIFEGTAGTVTLGEAIDIGNMTISTANYKITGNTLSFASGSTITNTGNSVIIESGITGIPNVSPAQGGNQNLTFAPTAGSMTLGTISRPGDNYVNFGGTTTGNSLVAIPKGVKNAKVRFNGSGEWTVGNVYGGYIDIQDTCNLIVNGTLTCDYRQIRLMGGVLHYNNPAAIGPNEPFYIMGGDLDNTFGAAITESTNNPSSSWQADWSFIGSNGADSDLFFGTGAVTLVGNRTVTIQNSAATLTFGGSVGDAGSNYGFTKAGPGTLALNGASNSYTGDTVVAGGTLSLGQPGLADGGSVYIDTGATLGLDFSGADNIFNLFIADNPLPAGTYGHTSSGADNGGAGVGAYDAYFSGSGTVESLGGVYTDGRFFWDGPDAGDTGDGVSDGGAGIWSITNANWDHGFTTRKAWDNSAATNKAIFSGAAGDVTLDSDITLGELVFDSAAASGYKIIGDKIVDDVLVSSSSLNFADGGAKIISVNSDDVVIESGITGSPDVVAGTPTGNKNLTFAPTTQSMTLGTITRPKDTYVTLGGETTGNSVVAIPKGNNNAKVRKNGSGTWTVGNVYGGYIYIDAGNLIVNGELTCNYRQIKLNGGVLHYNNPGVIASNNRFEFRGGSLDNTSGAAITESTYNYNYGLYGDLTFIGSNGADSDLNLGTGTATMNADRTVTVENADATLTIGGAVVGAGKGLTKDGPGTLALNGGNTYDGPTVVDAGTLAGIGTIASATTVYDGAAIAPGDRDALGTLTVSNNVTVAAAGTLSARVNGHEGVDELSQPYDTRDADKLAVTGNLSIADALLELNFFPGGDDTSKFGGTYTIATYATQLGAADKFVVDGGSGLPALVSGNLGNIGQAYLKSVTYDVSQGDGTWGIEVELYNLGDGDINLDGRVDVSDLTILSQSWDVLGTKANDWLSGDLSFDEKVDVSDLSILSQSWAPGGIEMTGADPNTTAIPEPTSAMMLLLAAAGLFAYRRRR